MTALADELVQTPLERRCLEELRAAAGEVDGTMERHCLRLFLFVEMLAELRRVAIDRELVFCAAMVHDAGIYDSVTHGGTYTDESGELAAGLFAEAGVDAQRIQLVDDACTYHHALRDQSRRGTEVELVRLADRIEVSGGTLRAGLTRDQIRDVFERVPRDGFYTGIGALVGRVLLHRPLSLPRIFKTD